MTKILIDLATAQQALNLIERLNLRGWILADFEEEVYASIAALKAALAQPPLPVLEPTPWRDMVVVSLVREGVNKHKARELADHFATQPLPVQESVSMRMPKVGDKVICLEDESLGEVVSLTAGGSPDIKFDDGSHGTYLLREFAELFGYVASPLPVQPEPVPWDKPSVSFDEWWNGDYEDPANPFEKDSAAYWAWAGWQAAQRPWVELTDEEMSDIVADIDVDFGDLLWKVVCLTKIIEATLKERNK